MKAGGGRDRIRLSGNERGRRTRRSSPGSRGSSSSIGHEVDTPSAEVPCGRGAAARWSSARVPGDRTESRRETPKRRRGRCATVYVRKTGEPRNPGACATLAARNR